MACAMRSTRGFPMSVEEKVFLEPISNRLAGSEVDTDSLASVAWNCDESMFTRYNVVDWCNDP